MFARRRRWLAAGVVLARSAGAQFGSQPRSPMWESRARVHRRSRPLLEPVDWRCLAWSVRSLDVCVASRSGCRLFMVQSRICQRAPTNKTATEQLHLGWSALLGVGQHRSEHRASRNRPPLFPFGRCAAKIVNLAASKGGDAAVSLAAGRLSALEETAAGSRDFTRPGRLAAGAPFRAIAGSSDSNAPREHIGHRLIIENWPPQMKGSRARPRLAHSSAWPVCVGRRRRRRRAASNGLQKFQRKNHMPSESLWRRATRSLRSFGCAESPRPHFFVSQFQRSRPLPISALSLQRASV